MLTEVAGLLGYDDIEDVNTENMGLEVNLLVMIIVFVWAENKNIN